MEKLEITTGELEKSVKMMSSELNGFRIETKNLTEQVRNLNQSIENLASIFETQLKSLNESLQTLGKNLTQNVVENILNLPKIFTKKRDPNT